MHLHCLSSYLWLSMLLKCLRIRIPLIQEYARAGFSILRRWIIISASWLWRSVVVRHLVHLQIRIFVWWWVWICKYVKIRRTVIFMVIFSILRIVWLLLSQLERWTLHASICTIDLSVTWDRVELVSILAWVERQWIHVWPHALFNWASEESCSGITWNTWICPRVELLNLRLRWPIPVLLLWWCNPESVPDFLILSCLVEFFQAISAHSHSLVISEFWHFDEILRALRTYNSSTFTTMMFSFKESELELADETSSSRIIACPVRPLSNLEVFNPSLVYWRT